MVIVTGGLGFIGSRLVNRLNCENTIIVDDLSNDKLPNVVDCKYREIISVDDFKNNIDQFKNTKYIFHEGAISSTTETNETLLLQKNINFSKQLINFAVNNNIPISYASSASVYGNSTTFSENDKLNPGSLYAKSKAEIDYYVTSLFQKSPNLKIQGYRYFNVYGKNEQHKSNQASPIFKFKCELEKGNNIQLFKNSSNYSRDFIYVEDIVDIKLELINKDVSGIMNLGTGVSVSFEHVANLFVKKYGGKIDYIDMPDNLINQYQAYTCADTRNLLRNINYTFTSVEDYVNSL